MPSLRPLIIVLALAATARADQLAPEMEKQLAANAKALSPLTIKWKQEMRPVVSEEKSAELLNCPNPLPRELLAARDCDVTIRDTKIRSRTDSPIWGIREQSFDGDILYLGNPDQGGDRNAIGAQPTLGKLRIDRLADDRPHARWIEMEFFATTGFWFPQTSLELSQRVGSSSALLKLLAKEGKLISVERSDAAGVIRIVTKAPDPQAMRYAKVDLKAVEAELRNGLNTEDHIQREIEALKRLQALPTHLHYAFYLDPVRGYAVTRYQELTENNELLLDARHDRFERVEGRDLWLPHRSIIDYYTWVTIAGSALKEPALQRTIEVTSIKSPAADFAFALDYHMPGLTIHDETVDKLGQ